MFSTTTQVVGNASAKMRTKLIFIAALLCSVIAVIFPTPTLAANNVQFGMEQNGGMDGEAQRKDLLDRQKDLGAKVIRYVLRYDRVASCNPQNAAANYNATCYDFSTPDAVAAGAAARGMKVIFSVYGVPAWANSGKGETWTGGSDAEFATFATQYANFIQAAATRYDGKHGQSRVDQWTIWNEPNGQFWTPLRDDFGNPIGAHRYAKLYDIAARKLKSVDTAMLVAPGPTAPMAAKNMPPMQWTQLVIADLQALGSPIDAWAHNGYMGAMSPFNHTVKPPYVGLGNVSDLAALLDTQAVTQGKPIWITEFGYQTTPAKQAPVSVSDQALLLTDAMRFAYSHPRITTFIWYSVLDDDIRQNPLGFQSGLYFADNTCGTLVCPKPSAAMFRHPIWVSNIKNGKVTLWGRGGRDPASTRIFVKRATGGWHAYRNTDTQTTGAVTVTLLASKSMLVMTCDVVCGPSRTIDSLPLSANKTKVRKKTLKAVQLQKGASLARGIAFNQRCKNCTVSSAIFQRGKKSSKVVARGKSTKTKSGHQVTLRFTASARRQINAKHSSSRLILRSVVKTRSETIIFERVLVLK